MELIKQQEIANNVYERWSSQYAGESWKNDKHKMDIKKNLKGVTNINKINEIIGNNSWTECPRCGECEKIKSEVLRIGQEPDYESATAYICAECLIKAVFMVRPIEFDRLNVLESLDYLKRTADNGDNDLLIFIEWLSPFLESK